jgi:hypothetical protein
MEAYRHLRAKQYGASHTFHPVGRFPTAQPTNHPRGSLLHPKARQRPPFGRRFLAPLPFRQGYVVDVDVYLAHLKARQAFHPLGHAPTRGLR